MGQQSIATSLAPDVFIEEIHGNLEVKGWERPEIRIQTSSGEPDITQDQGDTVTIRCSSNCSLRMPTGSSLRVGVVHGNARLKLLDEPLAIESVHGSLVLRYAGETGVEAVEGDLLAKQIQGGLSVERVSGNAVARDIQGSVALDQVHGNLDLRDCEGNITAEVSGNAYLHLSLLGGNSYRIRAGGNLYCRMPDAISASVALNSAAQKIHVQLGGDKRSYQAKSQHIELGDGEVAVALDAAGSLYFESLEIDWTGMGDIEGEFSDAFSGFSEAFNEQIEGQVEAHLEMLNGQMDQLAASLEGLGLSAEARERILSQARRSSERVAARAQERVRRAQEKMERKLAATQRKTELKAQAAERWHRRQGTRSWEFQWPPTAKKSEATEQAVSEEERLLILRMLEQKKISLEEAEKLLSALEGK